MTFEHSRGDLHGRAYGHRLLRHEHQCTPYCNNILLDCLLEEACIITSLSRHMFLHISIQAGVYIHFIPTHILTAQIEHDLYTMQQFHDLASQNGTKTRKVDKGIRAQEQICRNYSV